MTTTMPPSKLPPRVYLKHGSFYYLTKSRKWINLGREWDEQKYLDVKEETVAKGTVAAMLDRYMREISVTKSPRTHEDEKAEVGHLIEFFGPMNVEVVRPKHVAKYLRERGEKASVRANREKSLLSHAFTIAMTEWGMVDMNPCLGVPRNPEYGRNRYVTDGELEVVRNLGNQTVSDVLLVSYLIGQRISDVLDIKVSDVDANAIYVEQSKTKRGKITRVRLRIVMSDRLREVVYRREQTAKEFLFESRKGTRYTYDGFSSMVKRTVVKAVKQGLIASPFTIHDLRAKCLTDTKRKLGIDAAQAIGGHTNPKQTAHYVKRFEIEEVDSL